MRGRYFSFLLTVGGSEERRTTACGLIFTWRLSKFVVGILVQNLYYSQLIRRQHDQVVKSLDLQFGGPRSSPSMTTSWNCS